MEAEHAPGARLATPNSWATLGTHVVASLGSSRALEGREVKCRNSYTVVSFHKSWGYTRMLLLWFAAALGLRGC